MDGYKLYFNSMMIKLKYRKGMGSTLSMEGLQTRNIFKSSHELCFFWQS